MWPKNLWITERNNLTNIPCFTCKIHQNFSWFENIHSSFIWWSLRIYVIMRKWGRFRTIYRPSWTINVLLGNGRKGRAKLFERRVHPKPVLSRRDICRKSGEVDGRNSSTIYRQSAGLFQFRMAAFWRAVIGRLCSGHHGSHHGMHNEANDGRPAGQWLSEGVSSRGRRDSAVKIDWVERQPFSVWIERGAPPLCHCFYIRDYHHYV